MVGTGPGVRVGRGNRGHLWH